MLYPCPNCGADALTLPDKPRYLCIYCGVVEEEGYEVAAAGDSERRNEDG